MTTTAPLTSFMPIPAFLAHWQGHRRLTRRLIELFPEDQLHTFSIGGMRPFGAIAMELLAIAAPAARGVLTDQWDEMRHDQKVSKAEILRLWDESTAAIDEMWPQIPAARFHESMMASASTPARATTSCSTPSTTRSTTAARATSICARSASSRPGSTIGTSGRAAWGRAPRPPPVGKTAASDRYTGGH